MLVGFILAIAASEGIFSYGNPGVGLLFALFTTVGIFLAASLMKLPPEVTDCSQALALLPIYILLTASLPWFFVSRQIILPAVYLVVIGICVWYIYFKHLPLAAVGLRTTEKMWRKIVLGFLMSFPLGAIEFFILGMQREAPTLQIPYLVRDTVYMMAFVALGEEVLFRGIVQNSLKNVFGERWGLLLAAAIFGTMHLGWHSGWEVLFTFSVGLLLGWLYWRTKSLAMPIVIHGVANTILVSVMPYIKL